MKSSTAAVSTAIQLIYVLTLLDVITTLVKLFQIESFYGSGDPKMMAGAISATIMDLVVVSDGESGKEFGQLLYPCISHAW